jgi:hypothetical protein
MFHICRPEMIRENLIIRSILKGLAIAGVLILFQMVVAGKFGDHNHTKILTVSANDTSPINDNSDEAKFSQLSYGIREFGHLSINRATLCLFEIIFRLELPSDEISYSLPSPLVGYLRTLFSSSISVNAP